jgi:hypothetical protein
MDAVEQLLLVVRYFEVGFLNRDRGASEPAPTHRLEFHISRDNDYCY